MYVTRIPAPPRYQLDLSENELVRIAICLATAESGWPKVYSSFPSEIKEIRDQIREQGRDRKFLAEGAKP